MVFRIDNAIYGFLFTMFGIVIAVWVYSEDEWSTWPILGGVGAIIAGLAMLWSAFRGRRG